MTEISEGTWYQTTALLSLVLLLCSAGGTKHIFRDPFFVSGVTQREKILTSEAVGFSVISDHDAASDFINVF